MRTLPITLHGQHVRLEPLSLDHLPGLWQAGDDATIWRWYVERIGSEPDMERFIRLALAAQAAGQALPFATIDVRTGKPVGSTRFGNIDAAHLRVEIGWTWLCPSAQRTAMNTEAKYLMLQHAFSVWGCIRVEFKTDSLNARSRAALLRIGAKEEGTLRNHFICDSGRYRHSVFFSITDDEWPAAKAGLIARLAAS
jgi:RimJ/RimL family protein N-acetyltransferase